ncbi:hybrid sensor histidine kinase/response regulator [Burkholderia ubonensis]|uniref:hybrid sensor histidine kinase/response regulator n=1 Tax=Burkholderia ubonensis TaxID=101571 RepID=UPI000751EB84|nr:hybrid sensor histidine kinase/response regulator [Burkholderia ubonensis]KVG77097.1 hybrid sensor histidine kinase/response regulator [Burkholderia ubonensis]KVH15916.1 hybrid sensor histidine kinase/response regulator [Burkholderia ubonensis]KVH44734.1 hybrid sensor histidine kinase/response regulator [Burkholderia ubonensis]KVH82453.1 hybrid sensor histidine kinase/response regulator [Burkholderia ubonensis]KVM29100.1 hybrid sensor histidine kinase/response regulator [Burkholderia ubonen
MSADDDLSRLSLLELYREETRTQTQALSERLLALESGAPDAAALEACMRAAHSLKGAARIVGVPQGVDIAGRMEECFVAAQGGASALTTAQVDALLAGVDLLVRVGDPQAQPVAPAEIETFAAALAAAGDPGTTQTLTAVSPPHDDVPRESGRPAREAAQFGGDAAPPPAASAADPAQSARGVGANTGAIRRVRADSLNRLLSLSGESLVESRWLKPFAESMLRVKRAQRDAARSLDTLVERFAGELDAGVLASLGEVRHMLNDLQRSFSERMDALDRFERRSTHIAEQLYDEALQCRMRPFGDATRAYPRIVRDLARSLGRQVRFSIVGEATQVDRDILDLLDAPLGHLLRNAIDHGVEPPDVRRARGKPAAASVTLEARHSAGSLLVSVSDDGPGVDLDALRAAVVRQHLTDDETAARLSDQELLEFLLLPGFSMRDAVTDVSGRGVGLDAVQEMVRGVRGAVRIFNEPGAGMRFVLQLPLTLSVIRSLLVEVGGEPYAFPLAHVRRTLELERADIDVLEGQPHFPFDGRRVGLVAAHQLLDAGEPDAPRARTAVVVVGGEPEPVGVAVDRFLGERMLVVQPLDSRLHKIQNIAAGALLENGDPVLIVDVEDLIRSVDKLVRGGQLATLVRGPQHALADRRRRVLVVDDSLTVRELERKLLEKRGYDVTIAVDGMDGWNAVRGEAFDLVVTDVDMPRMDGIELVTLIKNDPQLKRVPVMIVSYKDRDEDRRRGLDAGADYYLAKGSFHDEALLDAVHDLIGDARG